MTDNEIIKALECCASHESCMACKHCPFDEKDICVEDSLALYKFALDLINRQKAEIERLEAMIDAAEEHFAPLPFKNKFDEYIEKSKSEAIKEFAEKVNRKLWDLPTMSDEDGEYDYVCMESLQDYIDNIVKEMVGE